MAIEIVSFPIKNGGSFHSYVKLPEGIKKNIVFCCVFPVRLSWLFVVFEKDFSGFGGDL
jgi:hypothetical protein